MNLKEQRFLDFNSTETDLSLYPATDITSTLLYQKIFLL